MEEQKNIEAVKVWIRCSWNSRTRSGTYSCICEDGRRFSMREYDTTSNALILRAAIAAICKNEYPKIKIITNSTYVTVGATRRVHEWQTKNWTKEVPNKELWRKLHGALGLAEVQFHWKKGKI